MGMKMFFKLICLRQSKIAAPTANKIEIRKAIEELGSCQVKAVNTLVMKGKRKRARRGAIVHTPNWKKAFVTLREGESLGGVLGTAFEGV